MTPIQSICPDCLTEFADALERVPEDKQALLNVYCVHRGVALSAHVLPGLKIADWGMFPADCEADAQQRVQASQLQEQLVNAALSPSEMTQRH